MLLFWRTSGCLACFTGPSLLYLADEFSVSAFARVLVGLYASGIFTYYFVFVFLRHRYWPEDIPKPAFLLPSEHELGTVGSAEWWLEDALSAGMAAGFAGSAVAAYSPHVARVQLLWAGGYSLLVLMQGSLARLGVMGNIAQGPTPLTDPSLMMKLIAYEHPDAGDVWDPIRGASFRAPVTTDHFGTTVWDLTASSLERTGGPLWSVNQTYTQCSWLFWRQDEKGYRSLFQGSSDHSIVVEGGTKRLGMFSDRDGQFRGCEPEYTVDIARWNFICVTGESDFPDGAVGTETFYVSTDDSPPQAVCTADRVISGTQPHFVSGPGQGAGYVAAAMHWNSKLGVDDIMRVHHLTIPASLKAPTPMSSPHLKMKLIASAQQGSLVKDPVSGTEFGQYDVTSYKGVPVWDLNEGFLERSWGSEWIVKHAYTQCFWVKWRTSSWGPRTLFRGSWDHALMTEDQSTQLGMYSTGWHRWFGCEPKYAVDVSKWNFICAAGNESVGSPGHGNETVYVSNDLSSPKKVGQIGHVVSGAHLYRVGWPNQGPGYVAAAMHWNTLLTEDEIAQVFAETVPLSTFNPAICNIFFLMWMICTPIAVACGYPCQPKYGNFISSLAVTGVGSYVAISGLVWATIRPAPDFDDVTFFIHHSSKQLDPSYDIVTILKSQPWILPLWWCLVITALCRRCFVKGKHVDIVTSTRGSLVWKVLPAASLQMCSTGCQAMSMEFDMEEIDTTHIERMGNTPRRTPSKSVRQGYIPEQRVTAEARDPPSGTAFLCCVLLLSLTTVIEVSMSIDWHHSYFPFASLYFLTAAYLNWNTSEFFTSQIAHILVNAFSGRREWKSADFPDGVPGSHRCIAAYCLLSTDLEASAETWRNCLDAYLQNLDPNCNIAAAVVSVTSDVSIVEEELRLRDSARLEMEKVLESEVENAAVGIFPPVRNFFWTVVTNRTVEREKAKRQRRDGQGVVKGRAGEDYMECLAGYDQFAEALREELQSMMPDLKQGLMYLHRNTKVLKKPGQYLDLMLLTYNGSNKADTYLSDDYGHLGRIKGQACFGYDSNLTAPGGGPVSEEDRDRLDAAGSTDISYLAACGKDVTRRFAYTVVLDKDTQPEAGGILKLVGIAAAEEAEAKHEQREVRHGILQPALRVDDKTSPTWHMFLEAVRQTSSSNTPLTIFRLFGRYGFFGKGLIVHRLAVPLIAQSELLPIDVLSHDTLEAMALCPGYVDSVLFAESPARNQISFLMQSTRWMLGEVKNHAHSWSPLAWLYVLMRHSYYLLKHGKLYPTPWRRVPLHVALASASPGARYLSQQSFRIMHAGPVILIVVLLRMVALPEEWLVFRPWRKGFNLLYFTIFSLFLLPKVLTTLERFTRAGGSFIQSEDGAKNGSGRNPFTNEPLQNAKYTTIHAEDGMENGVRLPSAAHEVQSPRTPMSDTRSHESRQPLKSASWQSDDYLPLAERGRSPSMELAAEMFTSSGLYSAGTLSPLSLEERGGSRAKYLWAKTLALSIVEGTLSVAVFAPECITGVVRVGRAVTAFVTGSYSWEPQDKVERDVEMQLCLSFIVKRTWYVPFAAFLIAVWSVLGRVGMSPVLAAMLLSWAIYPFVVYIGCWSVSLEQRRGLLWRWIDEIRLSNRIDASKNARAGNGFVAFCGPRAC